MQKEGWDRLNASSHRSRNDASDASAGASSKAFRCAALRRRRRLRHHPPREVSIRQEISHLSALAVTRDPEIPFAKLHPCRLFVNPEVPGIQKLSEGLLGFFPLDLVMVLQGWKRTITSEHLRSLARRCGRHPWPRVSSSQDAGPSLKCNQQTLKPFSFQKPADTASIK